MSESNSFISVWEFPNVPFICKLKSKEEKRCGQDFYSTVGGQEESWNYSRVVALDGIWPQTFALFSISVPLIVKVALVLYLRASMSSRSWCERVGGAERFSPSTH